MQSLIGTDLLASYLANRGSCAKLEIAWDGTNYVDESSLLVSWGVSHEATRSGAGIAAVGESTADTASATLRNVGGRFTPWYAAGSLYSYIGSGAWMGIRAKLWAGYHKGNGAAEYVQVFAGCLAGLTPTVRGQTVTLSFRDYSALMLGTRYSSPLCFNQRADQAITNLLTLLPAANRPGSGLPAPVLDYGIYTIPVVWMHTENLWQELSLLAQAEGGRLYFSPTGALTFENAAHLISGSHATSVATFPINRYADLAATTALPDYWNKVIITYSPYVMEPLQQVWQCTDPTHMYVRAGETNTITADFTSPVVNLQALRAGTDYVAMTAGGLICNSDVTITVTAKAQEAAIAIANTTSGATAKDLYITELRLYGRPLVMGDQQKIELVDTAALVTQAGEREKTISENLYIQSWAQGNGLGHYLLDLGRTPRMTLKATTIKAMPWLEIGDRVTFTEKNGATVGDGFVHRINLSQPAGSGIIMDIDALPVSDLIRSANYFQLGTSALGGTGVYWH